jgi:CHASE3 domain sensor protein
MHFFDKMRTMALEQRQETQGTLSQRRARQLEQRAEIIEKTMDLGATLLAVLAAELALGSAGLIEAICSNRHRNS